MNTALLTRDNPDLLALEVAYHDFMVANGLEHSLWQKHQNVGIDIANFRSDGAFLGQGAIRGIQQYQNMVDYIASIDSEDYLHRLIEDDAFAVEAHDLPLPSGETLKVSRDLLDSILEIYFVREALRLETGYLPERWLDIGSGYGRFAHRLATINPDLSIHCTDAVAISTFLCDFYLNYRGVANSAHVVPLHHFEAAFKPGDFDIACNIHSWSECGIDAINWWLDRLVQLQVPFLFLVPHDPRFVYVNPDGYVGSFRQALADHGYKIIYERPKYPNGIDGLYPEVRYFMYGRDR